MTDGNQFIGSSFESWLDEQGIREEVTADHMEPVLVNHPRGAMAAGPGRMLEQSLPAVQVRREPHVVLAARAAVPAAQQVQPAILGQ